MLNFILDRLFQFSFFKQYWRYYFAWESNQKNLCSHVWNWDLCRKWPLWRLPELSNTIFLELRGMWQGSIFKFAFPGKFLQTNRNVRDLLLPGFDKLANLQLIFLLFFATYFFVNIVDLYFSDIFKKNFFGKSGRFIFFVNFKNLFFANFVNLFF